ncbi:MAG: polymer-forming cytoskeletal protein [Candidatus Omnitrophica bacterium]|nr:polymer-forming cytoskeletal protein [Candidatus Omnitrophota bacterium]
MALGRKKEDDGQSRILDVTASMQGSLAFQEPVALRISGQFRGTLETKGELTIGEKAMVQADITGEIITVAGRVTGKLVAKKSLKVISPGVVHGEIWTPVLEVETGARIDGTIHMAEQAAGGGTLSAQELAEYLEVESRVVEQWAREGKVPGRQEGGQWRFDRTKIDEWVATQKSS